MNVIKYMGKEPKVLDSNFIAQGVCLIGDVRLGERVNIWFNSVVRADVHHIEIGENTNIQDLCMLHVREDVPLVIKENVTIGHSVTLHACVIGKNSLIGMGATILDRASIGEYSIVAAGSVVAPDKVYPPGCMIMGVPAKKIRDLTEDEIDMLNNHYKSYLGYSKTYMKDKN